MFSPSCDEQFTGSMKIGQSFSWNYFTDEVNLAYAIHRKVSSRVLSCHIRAFFEQKCVGKPKLPIHLPRRLTGNYRQISC
jgi:hypothetical protein